MKHPSGNTQSWLLLTVPIAVLLAVATGVELLFDVFRGDSPYFVAQALGQDFVTLLVALPALVIGAVLAALGCDRGRLVWLASLSTWSTLTRSTLSTCASIPYSSSTWHC